MNTKIPLFFLIGVVIVVFTLFIVSQFVIPGVDLIQTPTARLLANVLALGVMIQSAIFSLLLIRQAEINKKNNDEINARAESFRNLQFVASNHVIIEFFDNMLMYRTSDRYVTRLKERMDFRFYMRYNGVDFEDVKENTEKYSFLTVKIPLRLVVGDSIGKIRFLNFRLDRGEEVHNFVPCCENFQGLILWNESKKRQELSINLIVPKDNDFYSEDTVTPFSKIKVFLSMHSMLGVVVKGRTELYFTNPQKRERDGANKYIIHSSQFKVDGLPELDSTVEDGL